MIEKLTIYKCPYCNKKLINKNSYYNHISKKYCHQYYTDFEIETKKYKDNQITKKEYYEWCYIHGYLELLDIDDITINEIGEELFEKINNLYSEDYE